MDEQMIGRLLQTYGVQQPNVRQANAAREFFATNPEIAEKRAMGMRGSGIDDNSDVFGAQLDKFIADSAPAGTVEVSAPQLDTVQNAQVPNAPRKKMEPNRQGEYGPGPSPSRQGEYGNAPVTRESARGGKGFGLDDILTALLSISSAGGAAAMRPGSGPATNVMPNDPRLPPQLSGPEELKRLTYEPKLEDNRAPDPGTTKVTGDPGLEQQGKKAQLQAEIDAENADAQRLQDQIAEHNKKKNATRDLLKNAKRTVTGR